MRISLICNRQSGRGVDADGTAAKLRARGADIVEIAHAPEEATGHGAERIVAVGGDGTLAPAAALAARLDVPLAVVPAGTANDFARALSIPLDREAAIDLAARGGATTTLELAWMDDRPFVNAAGNGLAPAAARRAAPFKARLGPLAYPLGGVLAGLFEQPVRCRASADGREVFAGACWQLTVACTGAFGGGAGIAAADPADGLLDFVVVPASHRLQLPRHALAMLRGTLADQEGVVHVRGDELEVRMDAASAFNVDGEIVHPGRVIRFTARRDGFSLVGP